jgi:hypothetical protein
MANNRLNQIVKDMGQYFGVRSQIVLEQSTQNPTPLADGTQAPLVRATIDVNQDKLSPNASEFLKLMMGKSSTAPSSRAIIEQAKTIEDLPMLVTTTGKTSGNVSDFERSSIVNLKDTSLTGQGVVEKGQGFHKIEDFIGSSDTNDVPNVTVFQNFSPINSATTVDTDIVSLYMRSASSLEMSRAVPYLEINIASAVSKDANGLIDKTKNYTFLGRFLGSEGAQDLAFYNANTDPNKRNPSFDSSEELEKSGRTLTIIGGMESFTSPQTMVNADRTHASTRGAVLDQFQPFMSLLSLRLSTVGQGGLMSFKSGNLELMLHDRARLNEIASLIAPDRFGNSRLIITYGWCHPDGNTLERGGNSAIIENKIGELIDSMRVTETYLISNSKFSFEESSVKLSISIAMLGGKTLGEMDVSLALDEKLSARIEQTKEELKNLNDLLDELNRGRSENKISTISVPSFLRNPESVMMANQADLAKSVRTLRQALNNTGNAAAGNIRQAISNMFGDNLQANSNANNGSGGFADNNSTFVDLVQEFQSAIIEYLGKLKNLPDPFLPKISGVDKNKHVSLGKILTCFLANAFKKQFKNTVDMQIVFHPLNHEAARMHDYNISQFFFLWSDFELIIKNQYSPFGTMSFGKLFNIIQQYFINDLGGPAYAFLNDTERGRFQRSDPKNLAARGRKNGDKFDAKGYETALEQNKGKKLKEAYYGSENDLKSASFKLPQLSIDLQSIPLRTTWLENNSSFPGPDDPATVIRLHVMDRCCEGIYTASELVRSAPGRTFTVLNRVTPADRGSNEFRFRSNHEAYSKRPIEVLQEKGFLKPLIDWFVGDNEAKFKALLKDNETPDKIKQIRDAITESYRIFDASAYSVKDLIKGIYPSFDYGTLGSGIIKASISSMDDSGLATIMLIRGGKSAKGSEGEESTSSVPMSVMPASLSIETFGCPYFSFAQFFYIDFGTNTNVDNVYAVTGIDHTIEPGKFHTSVKLTWADSFAVFRPLDDMMREAAMKAILQRLGVYKNQ